MPASRYLLPLLIGLPSTAPAQSIPPKAIEDSVLGWIKADRVTGARGPLTIDAKRYSPAQLAIADSLVAWIQASYVPKGALGDVTPTFSPKLGLYNQDEASLPQMYGAYAKTYTDLKYDSRRKIVPRTRDHLVWMIRANAPWGEAVQALNTPTQYYFLMPGFGAPAEPADPTMRRYDVSNHPALKRYVTYFRNQLNSLNANANFVLLRKDNQLPFVKITKEEYLEKMSGAVERRYAEEKTRANRDWPEGNARANALRGADDRNAKRLAVLERNRERYRGRLQETAEVSALQPSVLLENYPDVFEGNGGSGNRYPVYKIDPAIAELAKTDQPQWIMFVWDGDLLDPVGKQHHEAILNNFNFEYVYNYFFDPDKVKGQPYRPLRSPLAKETVVVTEASAATRSTASDPKVHFFEDFSTTGLGQRPIGWSVGRTASTITTLDGLPGNWAVMAGEAKLTPKLLRTPLPTDFTVSYELVAAEKFTWGAKGLTVRLANESATGGAVSFLELKLRPGFDGRDGEAVFETKVPAGYPGGSKWLVVPGFSNNKKHNRITVSLRKTGEKIQVLIDGKSIADYEKAVPASISFNTISFGVLGSPSEDRDKLYITGIKISRE